MKRIWRYGFGLALLLVLMLGTAAQAAQVPWNQTFTPGRGNFVPTKHGYLPAYAIEGVNTPAGALKDPNDLFISDDNFLWVADSGNNRVLKLTLDGELVFQLAHKEGPGVLNGPSGVYVDEKTIYVADTGNARVVKFHRDGTFMEELPAPKSVALGKDFAYKPSKLVVDGRGYLYVVSRGTFQGLMQLDPAGQFRGFFASNRLWFDLQKFLAKLIATPEQREQLAKQLPPEHTNVTIDKFGNIYTTTVNVDWNQIKRYNSVEKNLLEPTNKLKRKDFRSGSQMLIQGRPPNRAAFSSIAVDQRGIITVIDSQTGQVIQYDEDGNILLVFGGAGDGQLGLFRYAASVEVAPDGRLFVLDGTKNVIQVFRPTDFLAMIHQATNMYYTGQYEKAADLWREVLHHHAGFEVAHRGIGKAMLRAEQFDLALKHYRLGNSKTGYSSAFEELRFLFLRKHFNTIMSLVILMVLAISFGPMLWQRYRPQGAAVAAAADVGYLAAPPITGFFGPFKEGLRLIRNPSDVYWELKWLERGTYRHAYILLGTWLVVHIAGLVLTSFHYADDPNIPIERVLTEILRLLVPFVTWTVAQYLVSTISDGEGRFRDVFIGSAYALTPYIFLAIPAALLTNVLSWPERTFYNAVIFVATYGSALLMFLQVKYTHNITFRQTVFITAAGLFAVLVIWGTSTMVYGLIAQMVQFVAEAVTELVIR